MKLKMTWYSWLSSFFIYLDKGIFKNNIRKRKIPKVQTQKLFSSKSGNLVPRIPKGKRKPLTWYLENIKGIFQKSIIGILQIFIKNELIFLENMRWHKNNNWQYFLLYFPTNPKTWILPAAYTLNTTKKTFQSKECIFDTSLWRKESLRTIHSLSFESLWEKWFYHRKKTLNHFSQSGSVWH